MKQEKEKERGIEEGVEEFTKKKKERRRERRTVVHLRSPASEVGGGCCVTVWPEIVAAEPLGERKQGEAIWVLSFSFFPNQRVLCYKMKLS